MATRKPEPKQDDFVTGLNEPLPFQRREWRVQRLGWVLMALSILAGALGLFGDGPLAERTRSSAALQIDFDWLARRDAQTTWKVWPRTQPTDGLYRVGLDANWAQNYRISSVQPQPKTARLMDGLWIYEFEARGNAPIVFNVEPMRLGRLEGSVRLDGGPAVAVSQFIYP